MKKLFFIVLGLVCFGLSKVGAVQFWRTGNTNITTAQYAPVSQVTVSTQVPISPTGSFMLILSTGGPVTFGSFGSYPAIATATATNGQFLVLDSTSTGNVVYITTGTGSAVIGDDKSIVISSTISAPAFIYNSTLSVWKEVGKQ